MAVHGLGDKHTVGGLNEFQEAITFSRLLFSITLQIGFSFKHFNFLCLFHRFRQRLKREKKTTKRKFPNNSRPSQWLVSILFPLLCLERRVGSFFRVFNADRGVWIACRSWLVAARSKQHVPTWESCTWDLALMSIISVIGSSVLSLRPSKLHLTETRLSQPSVSIAKVEPLCRDSQMNEEQVFWWKRAVETLWMWFSSSWLTGNMRTLLQYKSGTQKDNLEKWNWKPVNVAPKRFNFRRHPQNRWSQMCAWPDHFQGRSEEVTVCYLSWQTSHCNRTVISTFTSHTLEVEKFFKASKLCKNQDSVGSIAWTKYQAKDENNGDRCFPQESLPFLEASLTIPDECAREISYILWMPMPFVLGKQTMAEALALHPSMPLSSCDLVNVLNANPISVNDDFPRDRAALTRWSPQAAGSTVFAEDCNYAREVRQKTS